MQRSSDPFFSACASTLQGLQRILFPLVLFRRRAHRSCFSVSSWDRFSNFGASGLRWWGSPGQITPGDGPLFSRMLPWRSAAFVTWARRIGYKIVAIFPKIDEDFVGSMSWSTQPICRVYLNIATALLSPLFLGFLPVCERPLFSEFASRFCLGMKDTPEHANKHKMNSYKYLWCTLCTVDETFSQTHYGI